MQYEGRRKKCQLTGANRKATEKLLYGAGIQASRKATRALRCGRRQQAAENLVSCPIWPSCASLLKSDHRLPLAGRSGNWICWLAMGRWMICDQSRLREDRWGMGALLLVADAYLPRGRWNFPCKPVWTALESPRLSRLSSQYQPKFVTKYLTFTVAGLWHQVKFGTVEISLQCAYIHLALCGPFNDDGQSMKYTCANCAGHRTIKS